MGQNHRAAIEKGNMKTIFRTVPDDKLIATTHNPEIIWHRLGQLWADVDIEKVRALNTERAPRVGYILAIGKHAQKSKEQNDNHSLCCFQPKK